MHSSRVFYSFPHTTSRKAQLSLLPAKMAKNNNNGASGSEQILQRIKRNKKMRIVKYSSRLCNKAAARWWWAFTGRQTQSAEVNGARPKMSTSADFFPRSS